MVKRIINLAKEGFCNYDGCCSFALKHGYEWCHGERYGTDDCPLQDCNVVVRFKDGREPKKFINENQ